MDFGLFLCSCGHVFKHEYGCILSTTAGQRALVQLRDYCTCRHGENDLLWSKVSDRMGRKGGVSDFKCLLASRQAGLSLSETDDLLGRVGKRTYPVSLRSSTLMAVV